MNKNQVEKVIWWALKNLLGNLLPFIPFGFLLPIAYPRIKAFFKVFLVGMFAVLFIEIFQYMTRLGSFDIDDIILNVLGGVVGYLLYIFSEFIFKKTSEKVKNSFLLNLICVLIIAILVIIILNLYGVVI